MTKQSMLRRSVVTLASAGNDFNRVGSDKRADESLADDMPKPSSCSTLVVVYDMLGGSLMHPREPNLVGHNWWLLRNPEGSLTIQQRIAAASRGGGYARYGWHRPP